MPKDKHFPEWRKKKTRMSREPPLPVPVTSTTGILQTRQNWYCFTGYLQGSAVVVKHSGDIDFLYRMGFFGKGTLSRSETNFESRRAKVNIHFPGHNSHEEEDEASTITKHIAVATKRNYLKHLQYKALDEDNESGFNELNEQESMQRFKHGEDEEDEEDEEEEDYDEEDECESDESDVFNLSKRGSTGIGDDRESRFYLVSLLSEIYRLSKENIASFVRVPQNFRQLQIKFQKMRMQQIGLLDRRDFESFMAVAKPSHSKHVQGNTSQNAIDLDEDGDDVVVLNSDENSNDSETRQKNLKKNNKTTSESWDHPGNKGDAEFWGVEQATADNDKVNTAKKNIESKENEPSPKLNDQEEQKKTESEKDNGRNSTDDVKDNEKSNEVSNEENEKKLSNSDCEKNDIEGADVSAGTISETNEEKSVCKHADRDDTTNNKGKQSEEELSSPKISILDFENEKDDSSLEEDKGGDSDDSDDVICLEADSAKPEKLHNFLSRKTDSSIITKTVTFMTNTSTEPKFVNSKVGFRPGNTVLNFNFSGDETQLPTSFEVPIDEKETSAIPFNSHRRTEVYERVFPPINSLLADPDSKGVVIRQRLDSLPCVDEAKTNVVKYTSQQSHSLHPQHASFFTSQHQFPNHKQSVQGHTSHLPSSSKAHQKRIPHTQLPPVVHQKRDSLSSELETIASLTSSQFAQYFRVFHRQKKSENTSKAVNGAKNVEESRSSSSEDKSLENLHEAIYKFETEFMPSATDMSNKNTQMLSLNFLIADYLNEIGISLSQELVLLKILVCGFKPKCSIPEDIISKGKKTITPKEVELLMERLDFVQSCLNPEDEDSEDDVIMIDFSDEESNGKNDKMKQGKVSTSKSSSRSSKSLFCPSNSSSVTKSKDNDDAIVEEASSSMNSQSNLEDNEGTSSSENKRSLVNCDAGEHDLKSPTKKGKLDADHSKPLLQEDKEDDISNSNNCQVGETNSSNQKLEENSKDSSVMKSGNKIDLCSNENESTDKVRTGKSLTDVGKYTGDEEEITVSRNNKDEDDSSNSIEKSKSSSKSQKHDTLNGAKIIEKDPVPGPSTVLDESHITIGSSDEEDDGAQFNRRPSTSRLQSQSGRFRKMEHPYSKKDNLLNGDLLVVPNTSDEDEDDEPLLSGFSWQSCVKKDPFPSSERLHLLLEEAFFLSYGLGCLSVLDSEEKPMTITDLWRQFSLVKDNFIPHYVAYHYFRSKGWVPKSGLKFGCDFVLYREGPPFYHGSYSIVVVPVQEGSLMPMIGEHGAALDFSQRLKTWVSLSGLNRVTEHVAKELMYCYVICPKNLTEEESKSPSCVKRFKIKEVLVSRWVSSKERENRENEEMP